MKPMFPVDTPIGFRRRAGSEHRQDKQCNGGQKYKDGEEPVHRPTCVTNGQKNIQENIGIPFFSVSHCGREDLNLHTLRLRILSPACLPIPPRPRWNVLYPQTSKRQERKDGQLRKNLAQGLPCSVSKIFNGLECDNARFFNIHSKTRKLNPSLKSNEFSAFQHSIPKPGTIRRTPTAQRVPGFGH